MEKLASTAGIDPEAVTIEITETWFTADADAVTALDVLTRLRLKGFELSIDDFGTGYATLKQLKRVPFGEMKVDQSFVSSAATDAESRAIVRSSIELGHSLDLRVVAEGVESDAEWDLVSEFGCDLAQGFFIAKPLEMDDVPEWFATWNSNAL